MADKPKKPDTKDYVLTFGTHDGVDYNQVDPETGLWVRKIFNQGDTVALTDNQAEAFSDKFTLKEIWDAQQKLNASKAKAAAESAAAQRKLEAEHQANL